MKTAFITMCYNEGPMLALWVRHHARLVGAENLFILDHGSTDYSTFSCGGNIVRLPRETFDDHARAEAISQFQHALFKFYDAVIYTDTDEFLAVDPAVYSSFDAFAQTLRDQAIAPIGIDLIHRPNFEAPIDFTRPIIAQRAFGMFRANQSKPIILTKPMDWSAGFHAIRTEPSFCPGAILFHLKTVDLDHGLNRLKLTRALNWSEAALDIGMGSHQRISDDTFKEWFFVNREIEIASGRLDTYQPADWIASMQAAFHERKGFVYYGAKDGTDIKSAPLLLPERFANIVG